MNVLVTGGLGYIGAHTCIKLITTGLSPIIIDNLSNSSLTVLDQIHAITGIRPLFYQGDIRDPLILTQIFAEHTLDSVIHLAGLKSVAQSVEKPLSYYHCNVIGTLNLLKIMQSFKVHHIIFSSSATVYGIPHVLPFNEMHPTAPYNPYGHSKHMVEQILSDLVDSHPEWTAVILRYFNPVGAHESGLIGENPRGIPNNLMPYLTQVATRQREYLSIFGCDYATPDGTGVRDYLHVMDLADGHVCALTTPQQGYHLYNLGTGRAHSVLEMIHTFESATQVTIPYQFKPRRLGDIDMYYADPTKAHNLLDWQAKRNLAQMCIDAYRWQCHHQQNLCG